MEQSAHPQAPSRWPWIGLALLAVAISAYHGVQAVVNDDEVFHLRSIWALAHGQRPFVDFFEHHFPGLWILGWPLAQFGHSGVALIVAAKCVIPLLFGLCIYWLAALTEARGPRLALLGVLAIWGGMSAEFFFFRSEYVVAALVLAHLAGLAKAIESRTMRTIVLAAIPLGLALSMSVRPLIFLPVGLVAIWRHLEKSDRPMAWRGWALGLALGLAPSIAVLAGMGLLDQAWFWSTGFVSSEGIVQWGRPLSLTDVLLFVFAVQAAVVVGATDTGMPPVARTLLLAAWIGSALFYIVNPARTNSYESIHFYFLSAALASAAIESGMQRLKVSAPQRIQIAYGLAIVILGAAIATSPYRRFERIDQRLELEAIAWLESVAGEEPVVLVAPLHPVVVRDGTDLMNAWYYSYWLQNPLVRQRMLDFAPRLLDEPPAVINANPWESNTGGRDLIEWLFVNEILTMEEAQHIALGIQRQYVQVELPLLDFESGGPAYGDRFWVRKDRLDPEHLPQPSRVVAPTFTHVGPLAE